MILARRRVEVTRMYGEDRVIAWARRGSGGELDVLWLERGQYRYHGIHHRYRKSKWTGQTGNDPIFSVLVHPIRRDWQCRDRCHGGKQIFSLTHIKPNILDTLF